MSPPGPRSTGERIADTLAKLSTPALDAWVASAGPAEDGAQAHLVPLSLVWLDEHAMIAVAADSRTARNIVETGRARLALGPTRDVVLIDAVLDEIVPVPDAPPALAEGYAGQADWDPRTSGGRYSYVRLRPVKIQAWHEEDEIPDRTIMRNGSWLSN